MSDWLDSDPPEDPSLAAAYWCEMDYFLAHTAYGDHPPCRCPAGEGHNDPAFDAKRASGRAAADRTHDCRAGAATGRLHRQARQAAGMSTLDSPQYLERCASCQSGGAS